MNRGIDRNVIFRGDEDRRIFCDCLAVAMPRYDLQVHAYCLLGNHFHLLLFSESGPLRTRMRFLGGRFTQRIDYRDRRDGPMFRGRFASVAIECDAHLVGASRYVHRNPVEAGLVPQACGIGPVECQGLCRRRRPARLAENGCNLGHVRRATAATGISGFSRYRCRRVHSRKLRRLARARGQTRRV